MYKRQVRLQEKAVIEGYDWDVSLDFNPDKVLVEHAAIVISGDGWVIDRAARWFNLGAVLLEERQILPKPPIVFSRP